MKLKPITALLVLAVGLLLVQPHRLAVFSDASPPVVLTSSDYAIVSHDSHLVAIGEGDDFNAGKLKITAVVKNEADTDYGTLYNLVVEGYDAMGRCVDVQTYSAVNLPLGQQQTVSIYMGLGASIADYKVYLVSKRPAGPDWTLLTSAQRIIQANDPNLNAKQDAGKLLVQAIVKQDSAIPVPEICSLIAEGYDAKGTCIEVASSHQVNIAPGFTGKLSVLFQAPTQIVQVKTYLVDGSAEGDEWQLISNSGRVVARDELNVNAISNAGKFQVQAVIKNNIKKPAKELCTIIVQGYDSKGNCIDLATARIINVGKGFTNRASLLLNQGQNIKSYKIALVDGDASSGTIQWLSTAKRIVGKNESKTNAGKLAVSCVLKNTYEKDQKVIVIVTGYNSKNKLVESQQTSMTMTAGYCSTIAVQLKSGAIISKLKVETIVGGVRKQIQPTPVKFL